MKQLVIVTVRFRGKCIAKLVHATVINGQATVPQSLISEMANELGANNSQTIQIG